MEHYLHAGEVNRKGNAHRIKDYSGGCFRFFLTVCAFYFSGLTATAQQANSALEGTVIDAATHEPLTGASVQIVGETTSTQTDNSGRFRLVTGLKFPYAISVSYVGYVSERINVESSPITIRLERDATDLDEVVVIGYGTQRKQDITGSVTSISTENFNRGFQQSVDQLIAGRAPGVQVTQSSGEPGGGATIRIRGANSINASNEPLYVIDGLPIDNTPVSPRSAVVGDQSPRNPLNSLNPNDIESIEILKDASAAAIYGSRGANGVILITTKRGSKGRLNVGYNVSGGYQAVANRIEMLNAREYISFLNDLRADQGEEPEFSAADIAAVGQGTNWQDEIYRDAYLQDHQVTFSGGMEKFTYHTSLNYANQDGVVLSSGIKKYLGRVNLNYDDEKFKFGVNLNTSLVNDQHAPSGVSINEGAGIIYSAIFQDPTLPVFNPDGSYGVTRIVNLENPFALSREIMDNASTTRTFGNVFAEYFFTPELSIRANIGADRQHARRDSYISRLLKRGEGTLGIANVNTNEASNYLLELTARYNKNFDVHQLDALLGYTYQEFEYKNLSAGAQNFPLDALLTDNLGAGSQPTFTVGTGRNKNQLLSYLGRVNYSLLNKYLLTVSFRADGSSRFGENNKFGFFPSAAVGWRIHQEDFLQDVNYLSELKLRASYGLTGNQEIGNYNSLVLFGPQGQAVLGGTSHVGISATQLPNPDLKWETTSQFDVGLDVGFLNNRITGSIDYFSKSTKDLLLLLPIPRTTGFSTTLRNVGGVRNRGFELGVSSLNIDGSFQWRSTLNFSTIHNEVTDLGELPFILAGSAGFISEFTIIRKGDPLNAYYGYQVDGVFQLDDDDIASSAQPLARPGEYRYRDIDGNGQINANDRTVLGSPFPDFTYGLNNDFSYRSFSLSFFIQGVQGSSIFNMNRAESEHPISFRRNRLREAYQDRWTPSNPTNANSSSIPVAVSYASNVNSRAVEDASFIRLKNVQLRYNVPLRNTARIKGLQVHVTGQNLFTITNYSGSDPEVSAFGISNVRADFNAYPLTRTFILGLNVNL